MPNVEGECWEREIANGHLANLNQMLDVAAQTARVLGWLHAGGHIHGNMKPANVLLTTTNVVKVWKHPQVGARTRAYASPEQLAGSAELDVTTDVWSWAVSVLHMFVGRVTWSAGLEAPGALERYMRRGPARTGVPLMPGALAQLLCDCLKTDPLERPASMDHVTSAMKAVIENADDSGLGLADMLVDVPNEAKQPEGSEPEVQEETEDEDPIEDVQPAVLELEVQEETKDESSTEGGQPGMRPKRWTARKESQPPNRPHLRGGGRHPTGH